MRMKMIEGPKLFFVAGESSGDRLGGALLAELGETVSATVRGVGGAEMQAQGLSPLFDMSDLSVMGFADVFGALPRLLWRLGQVVRAIRDWQPDAVVFIDNQVFSHMAAARLRRAGFGGAILLYVAPSVWAWKPDRAKKIAPLYDEILAVLPFEPKVMAELGGPKTSYIGHPATELIGAGQAETERDLVALLPGSRSGELRRHLPVFRNIVERLAGHKAIREFAMPTLPHLKERLLTETANWAAPVTVVVEKHERRAVFARSVAALAGAGTVTLELAMMDVPMVGIYIPDWLQMRAYKRWGKPLVLLPNIVLSERVIPEIEPGEGHEDRVISKLLHLIETPEARARQRAGFETMRDRFVNGLPDSPKQSAAARLLHYLKR